MNSKNHEKNITYLSFVRFSLRRACPPLPIPTDETNISIVGSSELCWTGVLMAIDRFHPQG